MSSYDCRRFHSLRMPLLFHRHRASLQLWRGAVAIVLSMLSLQADASVGFVKQLEAEQAALIGKVQIARDHPGFTGGGFADYTGEGTIKWTLDIAEPALYQLEFRYALAKGRGERPLDILSQGFLIKPGVSFPETRSFDEWSTFAVFAKLEAGENIIEVSTTGQSGPNVDHMVVSLTPPDPNRFLGFSLHSSHAIFEGSDEQTEAYYKTLDPLDGKTTFENWKHQNSFDSCAPPDCTHTVYFNGLDLGFGRSVFVKVPPSGDVASYLQNYPSLEDAIQSRNLLATVVMEYAPPVHRFGPQKGQVIEKAPKFTKFYAFNARGERINKVDLDGRGEKFLPGLCSVCHGGKPKSADLAHKNYFDRGDTGGEWIPWDLDTFEYHPSLTRAMLEDKFKQLNETVLLTDPTSAVSLLVKGWYGGEGLPNPTFEGSFVPLGWREDGADVEELYLQVVARSCRTCHNQRGSYNNSGHSILDGLKEQTLEFASFGDFKRYKKEIEGLVYEQALMPLAKRTFDKFWRSEQPKILDDVFFDGQVHQNPPPEVYPGHARFAFGDLRRPGRPIPKIAGSRLLFNVFPYPLYALAHVQEGKQVRLNGAASFHDPSSRVFASEFFWSFDAVPGTTTPVLTGADKPQASFDLDPNASSDIRNPDSKPYVIRFGVTNEFADFNEIIRGQLFSDSRLQPLTFTDDIYELLTTNFSSTRGSTSLSCIHCHSNGGVVSHADSIFKLRDFGISDEEARRRYAYNTMLTRINCHDPENSLILKKPSGELPHFGGRIFVFSGSSSDLDNTGDSDAKVRVLRWIMEGAPYDDSGSLLGCPLTKIIRGKV